MDKIIAGIIGLDFWRLFTILLAVFVAYVEYQQYRLSRDKFKLDLFEKRFAVFTAARKLLSIVLRDARIDLKDVFEYRASVAEAPFLYNEDITEYLDEIDNKVIRLYTIGLELADLSKGDERTRIVNENSDLLIWLTNQLPELKKKFSPYLKFKVWK